MGDLLRAGNPSQYFTKPPRPTQPPTLCGMRNEYQPKCGEALWLGVKGKYGLHDLRINVWVAIKLHVAMSECLRSELLMIKYYTDLCLLTDSSFCPPPMDSPAPPSVSALWCQLHCWILWMYIVRLVLYSLQMCWEHDQTGSVGEQGHKTEGAELHWNDVQT